MLHAAFICKNKKLKGSIFTEQLRVSMDIAAAEGYGEINDGWKKVESD